MLRGGYYKNAATNDFFHIHISLLRTDYHSHVDDSMLEEWTCKGKRPHECNISQVEIPSLLLPYNYHNHSPHNRRSTLFCASFHQTEILPSSLTNLWVLATAEKNMFQQNAAAEYWPLGRLPDEDDALGLRSAPVSWPLCGGESTEVSAIHKTVTDPEHLLSFVAAFQRRAKQQRRRTRCHPTLCESMDADLFAVLVWMKNKHKKKSNTLKEHQQWPVEITQQLRNSEWIEIIQQQLNKHSQRNYNNCDWWSDDFSSSTPQGRTAANPTKIIRRWTDRSWEASLKPYSTTNTCWLF